MLTKRVAVLSLFSAMVAKMAHADDPTWKATPDNAATLSSVEWPECLDSEPRPDGKDRCDPEWPDSLYQSGRSLRGSEGSVASGMGLL